MISTKRICLLVISLFLCMVFFAVGIQQSYRSFRLENEITALEQEQRALFEKNKQIISSIIDNRIHQHDVLESEDFTLAKPDEIIYIEQVITDSGSKEEGND